MNNKIQNYNVNQVFGATKMEDNKPKNFQEQVEENIKKILDEQQRIPEYGDFAPVVVLFDNLSPETSNIAGKYGLTVLKMPKDVNPDPKQRYIKASAFDPNGIYESKMIVGSGHKSDIVKLMQTPEFVEKLCYTYGDLVDNLTDL